MKSSAPNSFLTGSQTRPVRNERPNSWIAVHASRSSSYAISPTRTSAARAAAPESRTIARSPMRSESRRRPRATGARGDADGSAIRSDPNRPRKPSRCRSQLRHHSDTGPLPMLPRRPAKLAAKRHNLWLTRREIVLKKALCAAAAGVVVLAVGAGGGAAMTTTKAGDSLKGAGSSFVSPLVSTTAQPYESLTGVHVDYNPVGSGAGIA